MKKEWKKPQLIVMVRSNPEEAVLGACKGTNAVGSSPSAGACTSSGGALPCDTVASS